MPGTAEYDQAKTIAQSANPVDRAALAGATDTLPEILYFLARDADPAVRRALAANPRTPRQADLILALDDEPDIRGIIAEKIAAVLPQLSRAETAQIWDLTTRVLDALARDDLVRIRQLMADTSRGIGKVPSAVINHLARDQVAPVATSALGFVGVIEDTDLIEIVHDAPDRSVVDAVARRPDLGPMVSEAIVEYGAPAAVATLLGNSTARLASTTLDRVIEQSAAYEDWQELLVQRPGLTPSAVLRLANLVADRLVGTLRNRPDLDAETIGAIALAVRQRPATRGSDVIPPTGPPTITADDGKTPARRAQHHATAGTLTEDMLIDSIGGDTEFLAAALALRAKLKTQIVRKILGAQSAKGMTALAWRAGYSMRLALQLQLRIAHLPPRARLHAAPGGNFPLTPEELQWQIEFFASMV